METSNDKFEIIHETINKADNRLSVSMLCEIAGVSRSGYYNWVASEKNRMAKELQDRADFELILIAYTHRGYDKGAQGIYMRLIHMDPPIVMNVKKIRRLMKKYGLICEIRKANPYRRMAKAIKRTMLRITLSKGSLRPMVPERYCLLILHIFRLMENSAIYQP